MKALASLIAVGVLSWVCVAVLVGPRANPEVLYGMIGPLLVAAISWVIVRRAYLANPAGLMGVLLAGMAVKLVFLAIYAYAMLRLLELRPVPFVASFACYFVMLHNIEALFMRRLFTSEC